MPNLCCFEMRIRGKKEDCLKFLQKDNYEEENHFWRFFNFDSIEELGDNEDYEIGIVGSCAWSLEVCCRNSHPVDYNNEYGNKKDLFAENTKNFNLVMEVFSNESGCCFAEHYIYNKGKCKLCDEVHYFEGYWDKEEYPTHNDLKNQFPNIPPEETLIKNDYWWTEGGYKDEYCSLFMERSRLCPY